METVLGQLCSNTAVDCRIREHLLQLATNHSVTGKILTIISKKTFLIFLPFPDPSRIQCMSGGRICSSGQNLNVWHICRANPFQFHHHPRQWCHHLHLCPCPDRSPPSTIRTKLFVTRWKINGQSWKHSQFWKGEFSTQFEQFYSHPIFSPKFWTILQI